MNDPLHEIEPRRRSRTLSDLERFAVGAAAAHDEAIGNMLRIGESRRAYARELEKLSRALAGLARACRGNRPCP